jgi:hypothetical protein
MRAPRAESSSIVPDVVTTVSALRPPRLAPWPTNVSLATKGAAFVGAVTELVWLDLCGVFGFRAVHSAVARLPVTSRSVSYDALTLVRVAVRDACVFYLKPVQCLQRSAAVTRMLRRRGVDARLVIGYQPMPVQGHAWVEVDGNIVWDRLPTIAYFRVLDRV